ncbi:CPBP family intramembrane metalloprotease [Sphingomonas parva]|uniref:CPBP family intramembrane metalloprotease n=1 Tax=Sphingomonas parva TaxID=2555898 RepID=A0A4Y8ZN64_9SPHN|nr:CPBP family intramembrane glutamic endopeptidase [Sphingomonas parva]TFI57431.1 CPBP family intramembrane metalloprotease [Sphingomonas parva]
MTAIDHILAAVLAAACVSQLFVTIDPERSTRLGFYGTGVSTAVLFGGLPLLAWWAAGRPLRAFGRHDWAGGPDAVLWAGLWTAALLILVLLVRRGALRLWLVSLYRAYAWIMPRTRAELAASWVTSLAAGFGEEIAFRGFLLWYAAAVLGTPGGLVVTGLLFGCAHSYQRLRGMIWAALAGIVLGLAYLASGSLLLVILLHASWNVASFSIGYIVLGGAERSTGEPARLPL